MFDNYIEYAALCPRSLWDARGGIATNHKIVHVNRNTPTALRAPHEALGHFALESALDELAYAAGVDPVTIRLLNDTQVDPDTGRPFSTRAMRKCLTEGAARFGWEKRTPEPCSMRDGRYLIGLGMACAIYTHWRWPAQARVTLNRDGTALVEAGTHDIGTGTYTVFQQIAADTLGLPLEKISVRIGDTRLPKSHASIGSATLANAGGSVMLAAKAARDKAIELARTGRFAPFADVGIDEIVASNGKLMLPGKNRDVSYAEVLDRNDLASLVGDGNYDPSPEGPKATFVSPWYLPKFTSCGSWACSSEPICWRVRLRPSHQPQDRTQPGDRRNHLGRRTSPAGAHGDGPDARPLSQPQLLRLPRTGMRGHSRTRSPVRG